MDLLQSLIIPHSDPPQNAIPSSSPHPDSPPPSPAPVYLPPGNTTSLEARREAPEDDMTANAFSNAPLPGLGASQLNPSEDPAAMSSVMSIEDFEKNFSEKAPTPKAQKAPKAQSMPDPQSTPKPQPVPKALGTRTSTHTIAFFEKCQGLGIPYPEFEYYNAESGMGWSAKCAFLDQVVEEEGPFQAKRDAKEKVSRVALDLLNALEAEGLISKQEKTKNQQNQLSTENGIAISEKPEQNWAGTLLEYQRSVGQEQANYAEFQLGTAFFCEVTIPQRPEPFGSQEKLFSTKKAARQGSAKEAVEWLREQGLMTETGSSIKKKKAVNPPPETQRGPGKENSSASQSTYAARVASLATILGKPTPDWRYEEPDPRAPGLYSLACYFRHEGPIGEVRNVYGKKAAKEECARLTLAFLERVKKGREEYERMMLED